MLGLLKHSLTNLDTLRYFYTSMQSLVSEKSKKGRDENRIGFLIDMYFSTLIKEDMPISQKAKKMLESASKEYIDIVEIDKDKKRISYRVKEEKKEELQKAFNVQKASEQFDMYSDMPEIHSTNTLIGLITRFEEAVSDYLYALFSTFPDQMKDKQVTYGDIKGKTTDEIQEYIIKREVERIMWQPQKEWIKVFTEHKICFDGCKKQLETLDEIYARRNIWVHNSGHVNETYLNSVKKSKEKVGTLLKVDQEYLFNAFVCLKSILYTLYIESAKFQKENKEDYIYRIFEFAFDELVRKDNKLCIIVFPQINKCKFSNGSTKNMAQVNYWIAQKALGKYALIKKEIESFDTSAMSEEFEIAKLILLEKYDEAYELIEEVYDTKISSKALSQWPLFRDFRKTEQFEKLRSVHKEDFDIEQIEKNNDEDNENAMKDIGDES